MTGLSDSHPAVEGIFTANGADGRPHLLLTRCTACDSLAFPPRIRCAACGSAALAVEEAPAEASVYSWTTMPGTNPAEVVAAVRMANGAAAQGFVLASPAEMAIDMRVRIAVVARGEDETGRPLASYAFEPISEVEGSR